MATDGGSGSDRGGLVTLETIAKEVEADTQPELCEFSEPAKITFQEIILEDAHTLLHASIAAKKRVKGDSVSKANVEEASLNMRRQDGGGPEKLAGILGGILFGTGVSTLVSMILDEKFGVIGTTIAVITGAVGAFLIALDLPAGLLSSWFRRRPPK